MAEKPPARPDVRMRGFPDRAPVAAVQAWVDARPTPAARETVPLDEAAGRVLAEELVASVDVPAFARSAMDGWAVRAQETYGAADSDPVELRVVGLALPGAPSTAQVQRGQAVRIMTGAPVPEGADAVLPAEDGREATSGTLRVLAAVTPGRHVGRRGEDVAVGRRLLEPGRRLRPQDVGLAASVGVSHLAVRARPRVAIFATGDELLPPGARPEGCRIVDSNSPMLEALVRRDGGVLADTRRLEDDREEIAAALDASAGGADAILVTGGSSVGQEDHAPGIVLERGELVFHGVMLRPAAPTGVGRLGDRPIFLLPGNPVSCLCAYDLFAGRWVRRAAGRSPELPYRAVRRKLAQKIASVLGRVDYVRVSVGDRLVTPRMSRGASILSSTTEADGFVLVPQDLEGYPAGAEVEVHLY